MFLPQSLPSPSLYTLHSNHIFLLSMPNTLSPLKPLAFASFIDPHSLPFEILFSHMVQIQAVSWLCFPVIHPIVPVRNYHLYIWWHYVYTFTISQIDLWPAIMVVMIFHCTRVWVAWGKGLVYTWVYLHGQHLFVSHRRGSTHACWRFPIAD